MLVLHQLPKPRVSFSHRIERAHIVQPHTQRQRIDEQTKRPIDARGAMHAPKQHGAEHDVIAPGRSREYQRPCQMEHAGGRHAQATRLRTQATRQVGSQGEP